MVPRYSRPQMTALWEPEARYRIWFEIEAHATQKLADLGYIDDRAYAFATNSQRGINSIR